VFASQWQRDNDKFVMIITYIKNSLLGILLTFLYDCYESTKKGGALRAIA